MGTKWRRIKIPTEIESFFMTKNAKSTRKNYRSAIREFILFLQSQGVYDSIESWIQAIYDDLEQPLRKMKRVAEMSMNQFVSFFEGAKTIVKLHFGLCHTPEELSEISEHPDRYDFC